MELTEFDAIKKAAEEANAKLAEAKKEARLIAIKEVCRLVSEYGISQKEILNLKKPRKKIAPRPAKYKDPASGNTWTGQGRAPKWFAKERASDFLIA